MQFVFKLKLKLDKNKELKTTVHCKKKFQKKNTKIWTKNIDWNYDKKNYKILGDEVYIYWSFFYSKKKLFQAKIKHMRPKHH